MRIKNTIIIDVSKLHEIRNKEYTSGVEDGKLMQASRVKNLEKDVKNLRKNADTVTEQNADLQDKVAVLEDKADDVRQIVKQKIENDDLEAVLEARVAALDKREKRLDKREEELEDAETKFGEGRYADGLADGLRKAHEITAADRKDAMKVAMVAAASHTTPEVVKELNSNVQQITATSSEQ